jgi:hypothetical protein
MHRELNARVRRVNKRLLEKVKRIAQSPAGDSPEVKDQIETLAKAIGEVATHCDDLHSFLETLAKNVVFKSSR